MPIIEGAGRGHPLQNAGAPTAAVNEVQTITPDAVPAAGTFKLVFQGQHTAALDFDATANEVETALNALATIGAGGVSVAKGGGPPEIWTVTFNGGNVAGLAVPLITVELNTVTDAGGDAVALAVAESVAGVTATGRGAPPGSLLIDTTNSDVYVNNGTALVPVWRKVPDDSAAMIAEATAFFAATDIAGAEAEELTDGSTTSLHEHELAEGANDVTATPEQINSLAHDPGRPAFAVLRIANNVADGETVTIGSDVYEFDTDSNVGAGNIQVDVAADQTPTAASDALIAAITASGTESVSAIDISNNIILIVADAVGVDVTAVATTMAGVDNAWDTAALRGGAAAGVKRVAALSRVPNAQEVALDRLMVYLGWNPSAVSVEVRVTASALLKAWDGEVLLSTWGVTLLNGGATDWAATDTIYIVAVE